jgi:hypothetical protein
LNPVENRQEVGRCLNGKIETRVRGDTAKAVRFLSIPSPSFHFLPHKANFDILVPEYKITEIVKQ